MNSAHNPSTWGVTLLRVSLGVMFLAHSIVLKLLTYGLLGTAAFFVHVGLPGWLAYLTFACEALGGAALVLGVQARWVALALSPFLIGLPVRAGPGAGAAGRGRMGAGASARLAAARRAVAADQRGAVTWR